MEPAKKILSEETKLAIRRTLLSADNSLMAWIRTGLSMIGFGFTIYAFFMTMKNKALLFGEKQWPAQIGLILIALGILSLVMGSIHYWYFLKDMKRAYHCTPWRSPLLIALLVALLGIFLFILILIKMQLA